MRLRALDLKLINLGQRLWHNERELRRGEESKADHRRGAGVAAVPLPAAARSPSLSIKADPPMPKRKQRWLLS